MFHVEQRGDTVTVHYSAADRVKAGDLYRIPGHVRHKVVVFDKPAKAIDIFCPVRDEYR